MTTHETDSDDHQDPRLPGRADQVPAPAVRRLSLYLRELEAFLRQGRETTSSKELGATLGYTDAQVRKDLAYFGQFGQPGVGYRVVDLITRVRAILGTDQTWNVAVVGAGNLGRALATYRGFIKKGFNIAAVFDKDADKVGQLVSPDMAESPLTIHPMEALAEMVTTRDIQIGVITVPAEGAQEVAEALVAAGIKGILNFAPAGLNVPEHIPVGSVAHSVHFEQLAFNIRAQEVSEES